MNENSDKKRSFASSVGGYAISRVRKQSLLKRSVRALKASVQDVRENLAPRAISAEEVATGLSGRYADGGHEAFQMLVKEKQLGEVMLDRIRAGHANCVKCYAAAGTIAGLYGFYCIARNGAVVEGMVLGLIFVMFSIIAIRHDYAHWQITERRFGGLREYFKWRSGL